EPRSAMREMGCVPIFGSMDDAVGEGLGLASGHDARVQLRAAVAGGAGEMVAKLRVAQLARREPAHFAAVERRDRQAVLQHDELADLLQLADRAQPSHAIRRGELLAAEAGDETAAANLAPRLQAAIDAH